MCFIPLGMGWGVPLILSHIIGLGVSSRINLETYYFQDLPSFCLETISEFVTTGKLTHPV